MTWPVARSDGWRSRRQLAAFALITCAPSRTIMAVRLIIARWMSGTAPLGAGWQCAAWAAIGALQPIPGDKVRYRRSVSGLHAYIPRAWARTRLPVHVREQAVTRASKGGWAGQNAGGYEVPAGAFAIGSWQTLAGECTSRILAFWLLGNGRGQTTVSRPGWRSIHEFIK